MHSSNNSQSKKIENVACVILAGGKGTRLFPLTKTRCKPAVSFGGRYRLIDVPISNSLNSNLQNIFVISQCFSKGLNAHIRDTYTHEEKKEDAIHLLCPESLNQEELCYKGTADAIRQNLDEILKLPIEYFLILSGDQLYNMDLSKMLEFAKKQNADLTIAALPVPEKEASRLGILKANKEFEITDFLEKPKDPDLLKSLCLTKEQRIEHHLTEVHGHCYLASMGIYVFKKEALIKLLKEDPREDFGKHIIPTQIKKGKASAFIFQGYWEDIGTVASFYEANLALTTNSSGLNLYNEVLPIYSHPINLPGARISKTKLKDSIISDGSIINAKEITHCMIGMRSHIEEGTIIRDSIVLGHSLLESANSAENANEYPFEIGKNCLIEKAIIDENCSIGNNVQLTNEKKVETYDGHGVYIRDGIIIVTSGTHLPDNFNLERAIA